MTGDQPDQGAADDDPGQGSWMRELRDLERGDGRHATHSGGLRELATRRALDRLEERESERPEGMADRGTEEASASQSPLVDAIRRAGSFEDLELCGSPADHRYGRSVDVTIRAEGRSHDLELRLFRSPEDGSAFTDALLDQFDRWAHAVDVEGVLPLLDAAAEPRPWGVSAPVSASLADRSPGDLESQLRSAYALTRSLRDLHDEGVLHAGLDPGHVVYPAGTGRPHIDNVGLFDVYRRYDDPASALDPRYAPPEYFDDRYGVADRTTDVYGLGAVLFRLFTGDHPYDGTLSAVRESVLTEPFPLPSTVADVPTEVDRFIERATATDKFHRYDSARALHRDVRDLCVEYDIS